MKLIYFLPMIILISSCATSPEGKDIDNAQIADGITTTAGLSLGAVEANPLALVMLPIKLNMGRIADKKPCKQRRKIKRIVNSMTYGAVGNNTLVIATLLLRTSINPLWGAAAGVTTGRVYWKKNIPEPCAPDNRTVAKATLVQFVTGIEEGNVSMMSQSTVPNIGREYAHLIRNTADRKYNFHIDNWDMMDNNVVKVDGAADIRYVFHSAPEQVYKGRLSYYIDIKNGKGRLIKIEKDTLKLVIENHTNTKKINNLENGTAKLTSVERYYMDEYSKRSIQTP